MIVDVYLPGTDRPTPTVVGVGPNPGVAAGAPLVATSVGTADRQVVDHPNVELMVEGSFVLPLPLAPISAEHSRLSATWVELERPGYKPILTYGGEPLEQLKLRILLGFPSRQRTVEPIISALRAMSKGPRAKLKVRVRGLGGSPAGDTTRVQWWRITDFTYEPLDFQEGTNEVTRADVTLVLTEVSDPEKGNGPLSGGADGSAFAKAQQDAIRQAIADSQPDYGSATGRGAYVPPPQSVNGPQAGEGARAGKKPTGASVTILSSTPGALPESAAYKKGEPIPICLQRNGYNIPWQVVADYNKINTISPPTGTVLKIPPGYYVGNNPGYDPSERGNGGGSF